MFGWVWFRLRPGGMNQKDCGPRTVCPRIKSNSQLNKIIEGNNTQGTNKEYRLNSLEKNTTTTVQCKCPCTVRIRIPKLVKNKYKQLGFRSKWCDPCSIMYGFFFFFFVFKCFSTQIYWWYIPTIAELMLAQEKRRIWSTHLNRIPPHLIGSSAFDLMQITRNNLAADQMESFSFNFLYQEPSQCLDLSHFRQYLLSPVQHKVNGFYWTTGRNGFKSVWKKIKWLSNKWLNLLYTWRNERNIYHTPRCCRREKKSPGTATT